MSEFQAIGGVKRLGTTNYKTWSTCMTSYLTGQDLWDVVGGANTTEPRIDTNGAIHKWKVKTGKAMFIIKTTIEEELLEYIQDLTTPKEAWDTLKTLFSKKNDTKLQFLENELLSVSQRDLTIPQYFHKVKTLCREIGELDPEGKIGEPRMKRIIIHGLKPEYRSFVTAVHGWPTQPSLNEFENLLASQEALAKQLGSVSMSSTSKYEDRVLYVGRGKGKHKAGNKQKGWYKNSDKNKHQEHGDKKSNSQRQEEASGERKQQTNGKYFPYKCHRCGRKGHMAKNCPVKQEDEGNNATVEQEEGWDIEALVAQREEVVTFTATTQKNKLDGWIVDSGCSNHLIGNKDKL